MKLSFYQNPPSISHYTFAKSKYQMGLSVFSSFFLSSFAFSRWMFSRCGIILPSSLFPSFPKLIISLLLYGLLVSAAVSLFLPPTPFSSNLIIFSSSSSSFSSIFFFFYGWLSLLGRGIRFRSFLSPFFLIFYFSFRGKLFPPKLTKGMRQEKRAIGTNKDG